MIPETPKDAKPLTRYKIDDYDRLQESPTGFLCYFDDHEAALAALTKERDELHKQIEALRSETDSSETRIKVCRGRWQSWYLEQHSLHERRMADQQGHTERKACKHRSND